MYHGQGKHNQRGRGGWLVATGFKSQPIHSQLNIIEFLPCAKAPVGTKIRIFFLCLDRGNGLEGKEEKEEEEQGEEEEEGES